MDGEIATLTKSLIHIAKDRLNEKQRKVLVFLKDSSKNLNATQMVLEISSHLNCAPSTVWNILRFLRRFDLVEFGSRNKKGAKLCLTFSGKILSMEIKNERP